MPQAKKEPLLSQSQPELEPRSKFWATVNTRNEAKGKLPTTPAYDKPPTGLSPPELQPTNEPWALKPLTSILGRFWTNESPLTLELRGRSHMSAKAKGKVEGKKPATKVTNMPPIKLLCSKSQSLDSPFDKGENTKCIGIWKPGKDSTTCLNWPREKTYSGEQPPSNNGLDKGWGRDNTIKLSSWNERTNTSTMQTEGETTCPQTWSSASNSKEANQWLLLPELKPSHTRWLKPKLPEENKTRYSRKKGTKSMEGKSQWMPSWATDERRGRTLGSMWKQPRANESLIKEIANYRDQGSEMKGVQVGETRRKHKHSWGQLKALIDHWLEQTSGKEEKEMQEHKLQDPMTQKKEMNGTLVCKETNQEQTPLNGKLKCQPR